jgi:hypothetical protein
MTALGLSGLKIQSSNGLMPAPFPIKALNPGVKGVFFQVRDVKHIPDETSKLYDVLNKAGIKALYYTNPMFAENDYGLSVGLK